ncbi:proton-conducting transporter membrane subunit [soil metagenome]
MKALEYIVPLLETTMLTTALWFAALGPLALAYAGLIRPAGDERSSCSTTLKRASWAAMLACAAALATGAAVISNGALHTGTIGVAGVGFGLYLDTLSALMYALVSFIGTIVLLYSRNYMDGDPGQGRFVRRLAVTLAAVLLLIVSGNLFQLTLAWLATSLGLHGLLVFYRDRPAGLLAARKKFLLSRLGEICLVLAMVLIHRSFGSLDYRVVFSGVDALRAAGPAPGSIQVAGILLVGAALFKSAQFPLHGWLIEVMETPTPVSALLHAGIINAGGFLILRFAGLISLSVHALDLLVIVGALTALFGSLVMLTQTSVKVSLAYSTIAQMGFMMLQCGLGAFSAALLHIVAHSLYKAHAFLSSGSVIDIARASWSPSPSGRPHPARMILAIIAVLGVAVGVGTLFGATLSAKPGVFALGAIVLLGLVHLLANSIDERPSIYVIGRTLALAVLVALAYFGLQWTAEWLLAGSLPATEALRGPLDGFIIAAVVVAFAALTLFQSLLSWAPGPSSWHALYAHVSNGFYLNTIANRWILRFWPAASRRALPLAAANVNNAIAGSKS